MADAPEAPEETRPQPGESIAKRLFSRGATRASVGSRAEFYHRLGVDDPYAVEDASEGADGPFSYLSSSAYYRDLRRSRLGLISRISGGGSRLGRVGQRAQRVGPAAMASRPSMLARHMGTEAEFEFLDDPVLLARAEEEEEGFRWPRTKPRPSRKVGPKARPMEAAVQREVVEVSTGADELQRLIARALQTVRGSQREKLLELLGEVQKAPERDRRAVVRRAVRGLRGPAAAATRAEVVASEESTSKRAGAVAQSRADLRRSKGLRPTLSPSPAVFNWLEPEAEALEEAPTAPRRTRRPRAAATPTRGRRPSTAAIVARVLDAESAAIDGGLLSAEPSSAMKRVARRATAGDVDPGESSAPVSRAATSYMRDGSSSRRVRALRPRVGEMSLADPFQGPEPEVVAEAAPRRRRVVPASVRAVARAEAPAPSAVSRPLSRPTRRAPLAETPVRAATTARRRAADTGLSAVPRPVRRLPSMAAANLLAAPPELAEEASTALPPRRRRRPTAAAAPQAQIPAEAMAPVPAAAPRGRRPVRLVRAPEPTAEARPQAPTERLIARAFGAPAQRLSDAPTSYTRPTRATVGRSVLDSALFALAEDVEASQGPDVAAAPRRRRAAPVVDAAPQRARRSTGPVVSASVAPRRRRSATAEPNTVRAARRGVAGVAVQAAAVPGRRRRLTAIPTAYLEVASEEVVSTVTGADPAGARRLRRAVAQPAASLPTPTRSESEAPSVARPARRRAGTIASAVAEPALLSDRDRLGDESPTVRAARRGVVDTTGSALVAEAAPRRRRLAPVPTAYLEAPTDDVVASVTGDAPVARRRSVAESPIAQRVVARAEEVAAAESPVERPTVRVARRASEVPQRRRLASVIAAPTSYLDAATDDVVDDAAPLAPVRRRRAIEAAVDAGVLDASEVVESTDAPAARVLRRAAGEEAGESPSVVEAAARRGETVDAPATRPGRRGAQPMELVGLTSEEPRTEAPTAQPRKVRSTVRALARSESAPRRDRRGRVLLGSTTPAVPSRRRAATAQPTPAAPSARMLARGEQPAPPRRSTLRRAVPSFALGMVLPELLDALSDDEPQAGPPRRRRPAPMEAADVPVDAPALGLAEVARRTSNAVRAMERTEQSVLTFDAVRRTFGEETTLPSRRLPTVEARVELDGEGRVRRVRATRLATGEQVLLEGDEAIEAVEAAVPRARRPGPAEWAEERAAVGQARGTGEQPVVRETPGARLVERAAVPDVRMRSGVGRRIQPLPVDLLGPARFDEVEDDAEVLGAPSRRRRSPLGETTAAVQRFDDSTDLATAGDAPRSGRRSRMVPGLGPITLAAAEGTDTVETDAAPAPRRRRRGPAQPAASRAQARRKGRSTRSLGGTLAHLTDSTSPSDEPRPTRRLRRRDQPELAWLDDEGDMLDDTVGEGPSWAQRAGRPSIGDRQLPDIFSKPRVRTSGGLLTALARAGDPEEVVRVILQRSGDLGDASMLAPEAQRLLHRVVGEAGVVARRAGRSDRAMRGSTTVAPQSRTVETNMLDPYGSGGFDGSKTHASATSSQGVGASKVMKLANKLMKLIHLAENDGRGDAHKHVRMAENASEARGESGAGQTSGEQFDEKTMNIKALRQDVLDAVLRALEDLRWRREDPDGPSFWC